jgi:hypothetical protein
MHIGCRLLQLLRLWPKLKVFEKTDCEKDKTKTRSRPPSDSSRRISTGYRLLKPEQRQPVTWGEVRICPENVVYERIQLLQKGQDGYA